RPGPAAAFGPSARPRLGLNDAFAPTWRGTLGGASPCRPARADPDAEAAAATPGRGARGDDGVRPPERPGAAGAQPGRNARPGAAAPRAAPGRAPGPGAAATDARAAARAAHADAGHPAQQHDRPAEPDQEPGAGQPRAREHARTPAGAAGANAAATRDLQP